VNSSLFELWEFLGVNGAFWGRICGVQLSLNAFFAILQAHTDLIMAINRLLAILFPTTFEQVERLFEDSCTPRILDIMI
jgi:hypothetical protein